MSSEDEYVMPSVEKLKMLWMNRAFASDEERRQAAINFDMMVDAMMGHSQMHLILNPQHPQKTDELGQPIEPKSITMKLLEIIEELEDSVSLIPPRVKAYRNKLAEHGLDVSPSEDKDSSRGGGLAGINLADQGALAYHGLLMNLTAQLAQMTVEEREELRLNS